LAAACAAAGNFDEAVRYQKMALACQDVNPKFRAHMQERLALFEKRRPYREENKTPGKE
jgi:hypothetical protein